KATELARKMVCEWGMSKELGPMTFGRREEQIFLGRDISHHKDYSEQTALEIDREVRRIIDDSYQKARQLLSDHLPLLHAIAARLLEKEVLDGSEVEAMVTAFREGRELPPCATIFRRVRARNLARKSVPTTKTKARCPDSRRNRFSCSCLRRRGRGA